MNRFPLPLKIRALAPDELRFAGSRVAMYDLQAAFVYESSRFGKITVPYGFRTDFASLPRWVWSFIDPEDSCVLFPSVIHDYLYTAGPGLAMRPWADGVLREAMEVCGASRFKRDSVYLAARIFGGSRWAD